MKFVKSSLLVKLVILILVVYATVTLVRLRSQINEKDAEVKGECCHSVFTEMADENVVPQKHHTGNGGFTDKSRTSQFNHITDVAKSQ